MGQKERKDRRVQVFLPQPYVNILFMQQQMLLIIKCYHAHFLGTQFLLSPGNTMQKIVVNTVNYEKSEATSIINLNNLSWSDHGNVTCVAKNILGTAYVIGYVDVESIIFSLLLQ